jgi:hypothetical protein
LLLNGELGSKNRDKDDVVDSEDNFECEESSEGTPSGGVRDPFHL